MRVLNGAQSTLSYLGVLAGLEHTFDDIADPLLAAFVRRMLIEESLPTLRRCRASRRSTMSSKASNACATRRSATATTRSPPTARRRSSSACSIPIARAAAARGEHRRCCRSPVAAWMVYLIRSSTGSARAGRWPTRTRTASQRLPSGSAAILRRWPPKSWRSTRSSTAGLRQAPPSALAIVDGLDGLLSDEPLAYVRRICEGPDRARLKRPRQTG